jgi:hypothetical protein
MIDEIKRIIKTSEIMKYVSRVHRVLLFNLCSNREDDSKWPQKNKDGRQELEIRMGSEHISFEVRIREMLSSKIRLSLTFKSRLPRLVPLSMSQNRKIRKVCVFSITWSKI